MVLDLHQNGLGHGHTVKGGIPRLMRFYEDLYCFPQKFDDDINALRGIAGSIGVFLFRRSTKNSIAQEKHLATSRNV